MSFVYSIQRQNRLAFDEVIHILRYWFCQSIIDAIDAKDEAILSVKQRKDNVAVDSMDSDAISIPIRVSIPQ